MPAYIEAHKKRILAAIQSAETRKDTHPRKDPPVKRRYSVKKYRWDKYRPTEASHDDL